MNNITRDEAIGVLGGTAWKPNNGGSERVYLNNWPTWIDLDVDRYKSGNVRSAALGGEKISNARASRLLNCRVWWSDGALHVRGDMGPDVLSLVMAAIAEKLNV